jgi:hypothetical protein
MGNFQKAHEKCQRLIEEYPGSAHAEKAKVILPRIQQRLKMSQGESEGDGDEE